MAAVGITLQPEDAFLDLMGGVLREDADYFEVAPETLWAVGDDGRFRPNRYRARFLALGDETQRPFVAHGVGMSLGNAAPGDAPRRRRWLRQVAIEQRRFGFQWYSDHLGPTTVAGEAVTSPMPMPMTASSAALVRAQLAAMQRVVPDVGFENSVTYFLFGRFADEPAFFDRILGPAGIHLVLDLHNVHTMARNLGGDPDAYLAAIDLGGQREPAWLAAWWPHRAPRQPRQRRPRGGVAAVRGDRAALSGPARRDAGTHGGDRACGRRAADSRGAAPRAKGARR